MQLFSLLISILYFLSHRGKSSSTSLNRPSAKRPLAIAHRGASGTKAANSLEAFQEAIDLGADMIELDILMCATGEIVVYHDNHIQGIPISTLSYTQILQHVPEAPTLNNVLDTVNGQISLYFDLKDTAVAPVLMKTLQSRCEKGYPPQLFVIAAFDHYSLITINAIKKTSPLLAKIDTIALTSSIPLGLCKSLSALQVSAVAVAAGVVTATFVADAHARGLLVYVWTVNYKVMMENMMKMGVDGIVSDYPDRIHQVRYDGQVETPQVDEPYASGAAVRIAAGNYTHTGIVTGYDNVSSTYSVMYWLKDHAMRQERQVQPQRLVGQ